MVDILFYLMPFILGGACSGIFCGLMPFWIATKHRRLGLGFTALFFSVVSGIILGAILAVPIAASFSVAILLSKRGTPKSATTQDPLFADEREVEAAAEA